MAKNTDGLIPWRPGQSGNPNGRPRNNVPDIAAKIMGSKKRVTALHKCLISKTEAATWESVVFSMPLDQLKLLVKSDETPMYPKGLAMALITDLKNGTTKTLDKLREWQFGKAAQSISVNGELKGTEPLTIEIIDSREQVDEPADEEKEE